MMWEPVTLMKSVPSKTLSTRPLAPSAVPAQLVSTPMGWVIGSPVYVNGHQIPGVQSVEIRTGITNG